MKYIMKLLEVLRRFFFGPKPETPSKETTKAEVKATPVPVAPNAPGAKPGAKKGKPEDVIVLPEKGKTMKRSHPRLDDHS